MGARRNSPSLRGGLVSRKLSELRLWQRSMSQRSYKRCFVVAIVAVAFSLTAGGILGLYGGFQKTVASASTLDGIVALTMVSDEQLDLASNLFMNWEQRGLQTHLVFIASGKKIYDHLHTFTDNVVLLAEAEAHSITGIEMVSRAMKRGRTVVWTDPSVFLMHNIIEDVRREAEFDVLCVQEDMDKATVCAKKLFVFRYSKRTMSFFNSLSSESLENWPAELLPSNLAVGVFDPRHACSQRSIDDGWCQMDQLYLLQGDGAYSHAELVRQLRCADLWLPKFVQARDQELIPINNGDLECSGGVEFLRMENPEDIITFRMGRRAYESRVDKSFAGQLTCPWPTTNAVRTSGSDIFIDVSNQIGLVRYMRTDFAEVLREASDKKRYVIVTAVSASYLDFAANLFVNLRAFGIHQHLVFIAEDMTSFDALSYLTDKVVLSEAGEAKDANAPLGHKQGGYGRLSRLRADYILQAMQSGLHIVWTDTDVVYFENILRTLWPRSSGDLVAIAEAPSRSLSSGLVAFRNTYGARAVAKEWKRLLDGDIDEVEFYQTAFTKAVNRTSEVRIDVLDPNYACSGYTAWTRLTCNSEDAILVHQNWVRSHERKLQRMRCSDLWLLSCAIGKNSKFLSPLSAIKRDCGGKHGTRWFGKTASLKARLLRRIEKY